MPKRKPEFAIPNGAEDEFILGRSAQDALDNIAFNYACNKIEHDFFTMWKSSKPLDRDGREAAWMQIQALSEIKMKLNGMINKMVLKQKQIKEGDK